MGTIVTRVPSDRPWVAALMKRTRTTTLLILAFLATLFAPVRFSWACPDGTPCVVDRGHGFVCASDHCSTVPTCCEAKAPPRCDHGAFPTLRQHPTDRLVLEAAEHCRFSISAGADLVALPELGTKSLWLSFDALPPPPAVALSAPARAPSWRAAYTLGYRPPPLPSSGPARAPPVT